MRMGSKRNILIRFVPGVGEKRNAYSYLEFRPLYDSFLCDALQSDGRRSSEPSLFGM